MIFPLTKKIAEVIWAETGDLQPDDDATASDLASIREKLAQLVVDVGPSVFPNVRALPGSPAEGGTDPGAELLELVEEFSDKAAGSLKAPYLLIWPGKNASEIAAERPAPHGWAAGVIKEGIGPFRSAARPDLGALYVYSAEKSALAADAPPLTSCLTNSALPVGPVAATPAEVSPEVRRRARLLGAAAVILFALTSIWTVKLGNASRAIYENFSALPGSLAVAGDAAAIENKRTACLEAAAVDTSSAPEQLRRLPDAWRVRYEDISKTVQAPADAQGQVRTVTTSRPPQERTDCTGMWLLAAAYGANGESLGDGSRLSGWDAAWAGFVHSWNIHGPRVSLVKPMLAAMLAIALLAIAAGLAVKGRAMGVLIDARNRFSLARTQMILWTFVLLGGYLVLSLFNIGFSADDIRVLDQLAGMQRAGDEATGALRLEGLGAMLQAISYFPTMRAELWAVLGLVVGTPLVSHVLLSKKPAADPSSTGQAGAVTAAKQSPGLLDTRANAALARLSDLFLGEEVASRGEIGISRLQHLVVTALLVATYLNLLLTFARSIDALSIIRGAQSVTPLFPAMPDVDATFVALLLLSHGTYLVVKGAATPPKEEGQSQGAGAQGD